MTDGPAALLEGVSSLSLASQRLAPEESSTWKGPPKSNSQPEVLAAHMNPSKTLAGYTDVRDGGFTYRFIGQQACSRCGDTGHLASACRVPQCSMCDKHGHRAACCSEACGRCGRQHTTAKGKKCRTPECHHCKRFGHTAEYCPHAECMRCGHFGHMMSKCPEPPESVASYSSSNGISVAEQSALRAVDSAKDGGQSLTDSLLARSSDSSVKAAAKKLAKQTSSGHAHTAANRLQLAAQLLSVDLKQLPSFELRPPAASKDELQDRSCKLISALCLAHHSEYAYGLTVHEHKLACLSRISDADLANVITHRTVGMIFDAVYQKQLDEQLEEQLKEEEWQRQLESQRQLEQQQQEEQQRQREQYEQRQQSLDHQRLREQRDRQQRQQRYRQRLNVNYQRGHHQRQWPVQQPAHCSHQQPPQPSQQQSACQRQQQLLHPGRQATPHSGQQYRQQPLQPQQQSSQPRKPPQPVRPRIELNVLDDVLPKGGKVGSVLVCLACGSKGHQVDKCKTPFCSHCCKYGHPTGACNSACSK